MSIQSFRRGHSGMLAMLDRARRNRYLYAAITGNLAIWALTALLISFMPRSYVVEWSLILPSNDPETHVNMTDIGQAYASNRSNYDAKSLDPRVNYRAVLTSPRVLEAAAMTLDIPPDRFDRPKIKLIDQSSIIALTTTGNTPEVAERKARALYQAFAQRLDALRSDEAEARDRGIEASIRTSREKLENAQATLVKFKVDSKVVSSRQLEDAVARIGALQGRDVALNAEVARLSGQVARLSANLGISATDAGRIVTLQADGEFVAILNKYSTAAAELAEFDARWDSEHPKVVSANSRRQSTAEALTRRARNLLGEELPPGLLQKISLTGSERNQEPLIRELVAIGSQLAAAKAEQAAVTADYAVLRETLDGLARESSQLDDLERRLRFSEAVFNSALGKTDIGRSNTFSSYPLVQMLEEPRLPRQRDKRPLLMALGGTLACSLLLSLALTMAWLRKKESRQ